MEQDKDRSCIATGHVIFDYWQSIVRNSTVIIEILLEIYYLWLVEYLWVS